MEVKNLYKCSTCGVESDDFEWMKQHESKHCGKIIAYRPKFLQNRSETVPNRIQVKFANGESIWYSSSFDQSWPHTDKFTTGEWIVIAESE